MNEGLEKLGRDAFSENAIENITLPSTLKRIEKLSFYNCLDLKKIRIPNGVEYIGEDCFWKSRIEEITFPSTLKEIG